MSRTQIYLPKTQKDALRKIAQKSGTNVSQVIRDFIEEGLRSQKTKKDVRKHRSMFDVLQDVKKLGVKGPEDLSKNLDQYLYGGKK